MSNHLSAITEVKASERGALDGYEVKCECGFCFRTAFLLDAQRDARDHAEYMAKKEAVKTSKKAQ